MDFLVPYEEGIDVFIIIFYNNVMIIAIFLKPKAALLVLLSVMPLFETAHCCFLYFVALPDSIAWTGPI